VVQALLPADLGGQQEDAVPALIEGLYWSAAVHGLPGTDEGGTDEWCALFDVTAKVADDKGGAWKRLAGTAGSHLDLFRAAILARTAVTKQSVPITDDEDGARSGARARTDVWTPWTQGGVRLIDAARIWPALDQARVTPAVRAGGIDRDRRDLRTARKKILDDLPAALNESNARASMLLSDLTGWLPAKLTVQQWSDIRKALLDGFTKMAEVASLRPFTLKQLSELLDSLDQRNLPAVMAHLHAITDAGTLARRVHEVAHWEAAQAVSAVGDLKDVDRAVTESSKAAQHQVDTQSFGKGTEALRANLEEELILLQRLLLELSGGKA